MSDTEKRYIQLKNEYRNLLVESGSLLQSFRSENIQLDGSNEELSHWEKFQFEFQLLILASELWIQTGDEKYVSAMDNHARFLRTDISNEMEDIYGYEVDIFLEYKLILQYLIEEKCCDCIIDQMDSWYVNLGATEVDGRYFVVKMVQLAALLNEKGFEAEAESIVERLLKLEFLKYDQRHANFVENLLYLRLAAYYYLAVDWKKAYALYQRHHMRMQEMGGYDFIYLCNILAEIQETMDLAAAVSLCDNAYGQLERFKQFVPLEEQWKVRYNHICLHFKMEKVIFSEEAESLFEELDAQGSDLTEGVQIIKLKVSWLILLYASHNHIQEKYLRQAQVFYDLSNKLDDLVKESPILNRKVAAFHLGCVYAKRVELMTAESYFIEAENLAGIYPNKDIDYYVLTNLNLLYLLQNDIEHAVPYANRLYEEIMDGNYPEDVRQHDIQSNIVTFSGLHEMIGNREDSVAVLIDALEEGVIYNDGKSSLISGVYDALISRTIGLRNCLPEEYREKFVQYLIEIEASDFYNNMSSGEQLEHLTAKALLYWKMGESDIYMQCRIQALALADKLNAWDSNLIPDLFSILMAVDMERGDVDAAVFIAWLIWDKYSWTFGKAMVYQNKDRLSAYADRYMGIFRRVYSVLQDRVRLQDSYYLVLNSKKITSLITVFRNTMLEELEPAKKVADEINYYMNRMADQKMNELLGFSTVDEAQIEQKLTELEYQFSRKVGFKYTFDPFRVEDMMKCIPDDSVFLEYILNIDGFYNALLNADLLNDEYIDDKIVINTYCFSKHKGLCEISRHKIDNTSVLFEELSYYLEEMGHERHRKTAEARKRIYHYLIEPFEKKIWESSHLYIAPDGMLCNLPFDVLEDAEGCMLGDKIPITMLDTGRDFLRKSSESFEGHFTVIGAPAFDYDRDRENEYGEYTRAPLAEQEIGDLPFTELEAWVVADEMGTVPYLAQNANKKVVGMLPSSRWAHIATHGMYDLDCGSDAWYSSALLFAGAENWRRTGNIHFKYGNGMVTSDEISRMKLSNMEMVVLSACFSGRTELIQMAGIREAFKDAGVKYIISALWQVDDLAGAAFMSIFYRHLHNRTVPESLRMAKEDMRKITASRVIGMIERCLVRYKLRSEIEIKDSLKKLKQKMDLRHADFKPYEDPFYWSAFTCYQNSF